jgi:hypothetical protein
MHFELSRLERAPYRLDLAPCDFFVFGDLKTTLRGQQVVKEDELK